MCSYCDELNSEDEDVEVNEIYLSKSGLLCSN